MRCFKLSLLLSFLLFSCKEEATFYRLGTNDIYLSVNTNKVLISGKLKDLIIPPIASAEEQTICLIANQSGKATLYIPSNNTSFFYLRDSLCVDYADASHLIGLVWMGNDTPKSFTDSMIQVRFPFRGGDILFRRNSDSEWEQAQCLNKNEVQKIIDTTDLNNSKKKKYKYKEGVFPSIPHSDESTYNEPDFTFSILNQRSGAIVMNLNKDQVLIEPVVLKDAFSRSLMYPTIIFYNDVPNLFYTTSSYNRMIPRCNYYSLVLSDDFLWLEDRRRVEYEFFHFYDIQDKDVQKFEAKYKVDGISITVSCDGQKRTMRYSDRALNGITFNWEKKIHVWEYVDTSDSLVTKKAFSPRTFIILYKLQSGEYILGGPSYKLIKNVPQGIKRIDTSDYQEEERTPHTPVSHTTFLLNNSHGCLEKPERVIVIYETPEGPQVWYCNYSNDRPLGQIKPKKL